MIGNTAKHRWTALDAKRTGLITRSERYAELTLPFICPRDGYDEGTQELNLDYQSVGAACVNNLINKMMLALFAPSRPFLRLDLPLSVQGKLTQALGLQPSQLREELAVIEKEAVKVLDRIGARPVLYELLAHLAVTGNGARYMEDGTMRVFGIKDYVARRNNKGELVEIITREKVCPQDLPEDVRAFCRTGEKDIEYYRWWLWKDTKFIEKQYADDTLVDLPAYKGQYKRQDMPIQAHCWRLTNKRNYGIGIVEDYVADFEGLSMLSEAEVNASIMASEFRWLINPGGQTRPEDFKTTRNGDGIPGMEGDVKLISAGEAANAVTVVGAIADKYIRRLGAAFLMTQSVQRDAERVTAEEIRLLANELETALGGVYSRQAVDLQLPLAYWLLDNVDMDSPLLEDSDFTPSIVTGLDALSRNGDLENLQLFMNDCMPFVTMPPEYADYFKLPSIFSDLAAARGILSSTYLNSQDTVDELRNTRQQKAEAAMQAQMAQEAALKNQGNK